MTTYVPSYSMPERNRRVLLVDRPDGVPQVSHFALEEDARPRPAEGQFLVRNLYLSVDPAQRGWANAAKNYSDPVPLGSVMRALAVGVVVETRHDDFPVGLYLYGWFGWQDYAVADPRQVMTRIEDPRAPLSAYAGVLGLNGLTAWLAFTKFGRPNPAETVLVSTAAGSVGSVVGQLAKAAGCRAVGLTGDDAKVVLCRERFGYDEAANYRTAPPEELVAALAPQGVDIYFDNVGGDTLDAAIRQMNIAGRIVQCGTASIAQWAPAPQGPRNEREILTRRLSWNGFVIFDYEANYNEALAALTALIDRNALAYDEDISPSIDTAPGALNRLYKGENTGKSLIFVG